MKERPILFSAPMVRALLDGRKTQTRRVVNPQLEFRYDILSAGLGDSSPGVLAYKEAPGVYHCYGSVNFCDKFCPYGKPGDRLWVRETWRPYSWRPNELTLQMRADNTICDVELPDTDKAERWLDRICQDATSECEKQAIQEEDGMYVWDGEEENPIKWRPSIFMPRWASRITLEITEVRVQRLLEISCQDVWEEGSEVMLREYSDGTIGCVAATEWYRKLWESNNGPGSWAANPWVWAISFKALDRRSA